MKRIIAEMFDWITAIDEAIEITAKMRLIATTKVTSHRYIHVPRTAREYPTPTGTQ